MFTKRTKAGATKATLGSVAGPSAREAKTKVAKSASAKTTAKNSAAVVSAAPLLRTDEWCDFGDEEWESVDRLFDTPQDQWSIEQWRMLAEYLQGRYVGVVAELQRAVNAHEDALGLLARIVRRRSVHSKALQFFEQELRAGRLSIKFKEPRKRAGRKPNLSKPELQEAKTYLDLLEARASGMTRFMAAQRVAKKQLEDECVRGRQLVGQLPGRTKTVNNKFPKAEAWATERAFAKHGQSLAALDELMTLKVPTRPKDRASKKKSSR